MGYTHYFTFKQAPKGQADQTEKAFKSALIECQKIAKFYQNYCSENNFEENRLSGYSAHSKIGKYGGFNINGKGDLSCEDLILREHFRQNQGFNFCKTAEYPYDVVVVACLALLKHRLGDLIDVSSDGRQKDFDAGVNLARTALKLKSIKNPIEEIKEVVKAKLTLVHNVA